MNTVTYHVYLTFGNGQTEFLATTSQDDAVDRVWASRNVLAGYAVYMVAGDQFGNFTEIVGNVINDREDGIREEACCEQ